jgi:hypothetical protein
MSFARKADRDLHSDRYIEAFYSLFFFLETLFAPGFSDPKIVKKKLLESGEVRAGIVDAKQQTNELERSSQNRSKFLSLTDEQIIEHFVNLRGKLHHHALPRAEKWHPEKHAEFKDDTWFLRRIVQKIALEKIVPMLFSKESNEFVLNSANASGAMLEFKVEILGGEGREEVLRTINVRQPGAVVTPDAVNAVNRTLRKTLQRLPEIFQLAGYRIMSADGTERLAEYKRTVGPSVDID